MQINEEALEKELENLQGRQERLANKIKERIDELDQERGRWLDKLRTVEKANGKTSTSVSSIRRYGVPEKMIEVIGWFEDGATTAEIHECMSEEYSDFSRQNTSTHLNRLKKSGEIVAKGTHGSYKYYPYVPKKRKKRKK